MPFFKCSGDNIDTSVVTATAPDILASKVAIGSNGEPLVGTMTNNGTKTSTLSAGGSYTIPKGYHSGSGKVTAKTLSSQTIANATASDIKKGKTAWVNGSKITGTLKEETILSLLPTTSRIENEYYDSSDQPYEKYKNLDFGIYHTVNQTETAMMPNKYGGGNIRATLFSISDELFTMMEDKVMKYSSSYKDFIQISNNGYDICSPCVSLDNKAYFWRRGSSYREYFYCCEYDASNNNLVLTKLTPVDYSTSIGFSKGSIYKSGDMFVYNNEIYSLCTVASGNSPCYFIFNPSTGKWRKSTFTVDKTGIFGDAVFEYEGTLYVLHGDEYEYDGNHIHNKSMYKWNGTSWTRVGTPPFDPKVVTSCGVFNGKVHCFVFREHYTWDGTSWTKESDLLPTMAAGDPIIWNDNVVLPCLSVDFPFATYQEANYSSDLADNHNRMSTLFIMKTVYSN